MSRATRVAAAALLPLLLGACAQYLPWTTQPGPADIDRMVADDDYGEALAALQRIPADAPDAALLRAKRLQVRARAARYAAARLAAAGEQEQRGNWHRAEEILRDALKHDPGATDLKAMLRELQARRVRRERELERTMLIARGEWLSRVIPAREELRRIASFGLLDRLRLARLDWERRDVAKELLSAGSQALRDGQFEDARRCLTLSRKLEDTPPVQAALARLAARRDQELREEERARQRSREAELRRRETRLHDKVQEAIAEGDWHRAQVDLKRLMKLAPGNRELVTLKEALDEAVAARIRQLLDQGNGLYRRGHIRQAKDAWEAVLALDPNQPQAQANVKRAQRVLDKLRELKEQAPAKPPVPKPAGPTKPAP